MNGETALMSCVTILMAEDDPDDRFLMEQALLEVGNHGDLRFVCPGKTAAKLCWR